MLSRVNVVDVGRMLMERIRASLSRSPFRFIDSSVPLAEEEVDMYVVPADLAVELLRGGYLEPGSSVGAQGRVPGRADAPPSTRTSIRPASPPAVRVPVIAFGPTGLMRTAFMAGAADYLREPWGPEELGLRALCVIQRMRRRVEFPWGHVVLDGGNLETPAGAISLTFHESKILRALLLNRGSPVTREALAYHLWGNPGPKDSRAIDVHVAAIRRKVRAFIPVAGPFIKAVRNLGYTVE
jgi:hypothetical protein